MTTAQQIVDEAMGTSNRNRETLVSDLEMLRVLRRSIQRYYSAAVDVNRWFYVDAFAVAYDATEEGWPRPAGVEAVVRIENAFGKEVMQLPLDQRRGEFNSGVPAVYQTGRVFYSSGAAHDPQPGDALTFYCSILHPNLATLASALDPSWPEQFNPLLVMDLAIYLAEKDGSRAEEVAAFTAERKEALALYEAHLRHASVGLVRSHGGSGEIQTSGVGA